MAYKSISAVVASANNVANPTTLTPVLPTRATDDLLIAITSCRSITATVATPSGWTIWPGFPKRSTTASGGSIYVFYKAVVGGEANPALAWSGVATGTTGDSSQALIVCVDKAHLTSPEDNPGTLTNANSANIALSAISTSFINACVIAIAMKVTDTATSVTAITQGYTERADSHTTTGTGHLLYVATQEKPTTAGPIAAASLTSATTARVLSFPIAVRTAPPTVTPTAVVSLASGSTPATRTAHSIKVRARKASGTGTVLLRVDLYEGASHRASLTSTALTTSLADYTMAIPDVTAALIADYSNLELRFWGTSDTSDKVDVEVARIALVAPAAAPAQTLYGASSLAVTFGATTAGQGTFHGPADLLGLTNWHKADALALSDGAAVTSWPDSSGAGRTLTNPGGSVAPTFQTNELNGLPGVEFDGGDDYLTHLAGAAFVTGDAVTVFAVARRGIGTSNGRMLAFNAQGRETDDYGAPCWCIYEGGANDRIAPYSNGELAIQVPHPTAAFVMTTWFDGTDHNLRVDEAPASTPSFSMAQMEPFTDFATTRITLASGWFGTPSSAGNYTFHEVVVYGRALTSTERGQVETYLTEKWMAPAAPTTHYGASSLTTTFGATTQARRKTFGQVARASTFDAVTQGRRRTTSAVAAPFAFGAVTQGQRRTKGIVAAPFTFGSTTAARRRTTSALTLPFTFTAATAGQATTPAQTYFGATSLTASFGSTTAGQRKAFGVVARPTSFAAVTAGQRKAFGVVARPSTFGAATVAQRRTTSAIVAPTSFGAVTQGRRRTTSSTAMPLSFAAATAGDRVALRQYGQVAATYTFARDTSARRRTFASTATSLALGVATAGQRIPFTRFGAVVVPFGFGATTQGRRRTTSAIVAPTTFGAVVQGRRRTTSALVMPVAYGAATQAQRRTTGVVARASTFGAVTAARKHTYGAVVMPVAYGAAVKAKIHTRSALVMPLTVGIATAGLRPAAGGYGAIAAVYAFGAVTQGQRKTFGLVARPSTFGAVTQAKRRTTSAIVMPLALDVVTAARRRTTSAILVPVSFAAVTQAQRRTFGRVALPLSLALAVQARRQAFGQVALPLALAISLQARRDTFAVVDLPLHLLITSRGRLPIAAVVLNDADMVYLSGQAAEEVAVGVEQVWPDDG